MTRKPLSTRAEVVERAQSRRAEKAQQAKTRGVRKRNPKTGGQRFPERRVPEYLVWIRNQWCFLIGVEAHQQHCGQYMGRERAYSEAMHVTTRGAGGYDFDNVLPACPSLHAEQHRIGVQSFAAKYGVRLKSLAHRYTERFLKETGRTL